MNFKIDDPDKFPLLLGFAYGFVIWGGLFLFLMVFGVAHFGGC